MLGLNQAYLGDSAEVLQRIDSETVDLVVTSPPYDNLRDYTKDCPWNFDVFTKIAVELKRVIKPAGYLVWVVGDSTYNGSESGSSFSQALYFKSIGFYLHDTMIYKKQSVGSCGSNYAYSQAFEYMFVLSNGLSTKFNPIVDMPVKNAGKVVAYPKVRSDNNGFTPNGEMTRRVAKEFSRRTNVWEYSPGFVQSHLYPNIIKDGHPASFPYDLAKDHILSWSDEGDLVLDPFAGIGTTLLAARDLKRNFIGIEISSKYFETLQKNLNNNINHLQLRMEREANAKQSD